MLSYQEFLKKIGEEQLFPVYLFYGEEKYLQEELAEHLAEAFLGSELTYGREKIEGSLLSLEEVIERLDESGLFSQRRLLIVDKPPYLSPPRKEENKSEHDDEKKRDEKEEDKSNPSALLEAYLAQLGNKKPDSILIFMAPKIDRRKKLFKIIDSKGIAVECKPLKGEALASWIENKARKLGKNIERAALEKLMFADANNLHYLSCELEKYKTYLADDQKTITAEVVDLLFSGDLQGDVFKLSDAMAEGNADRAHLLLELLLKKREKPLLIFFMLVRHYRLLLEAHCLLDEGIPQGQFASALAVHPFAARKLREQAVSYSRIALEEVLMAMQDVDMKIKTGRVEPEQALVLVLNRIDYLQSALNSV